MRRWPFHLPKSDSASLQAVSSVSGSVLQLASQTALTKPLTRASNLASATAYLPSLRRLAGGACLASTLAAVTLTAMTSTGVAQEPAVAADKVEVSERARAIHARSFVFDGHNDLPWEVRKNASRSFEKLDIAQLQPQQHTDIPRLRQGGVGAQFWSVYVPSDTAHQGVAHQQTLEQIEIVHAMIARYPDTFALALTSHDVERLRAEGKIASLIGVEGGHAIENSIEKLRRLFALGARYMTLTHSESLDWADSCSDKPRCHGLSEFGREVVREMNRLGMLVDISHVSPETMQATLDTTLAPVIFSHSSAYGIAQHPRNVPDEILRQLPRNGGVVMVNFYPAFIVPDSAVASRKLQAQLRELKAQFGSDLDGYKAAAARLEAQHPIRRGSVQDVADHIDHLVKVAGVDHVGIGSDYDGIPLAPAQLEDVSTYPVLTQVLLDRGYSEADIHKILSGNILRVMSRAEQVARVEAP
jgi:membrane dipeptidase